MNQVQEREDGSRFEKLVMRVHEVTLRVLVNMNMKIVIIQVKRVRLMIAVKKMGVCEVLRAAC